MALQLHGTVSCGHLTRQAAHTSNKLCTRQHSNLSSLHRQPTVFHARQANTLQRLSRQDMSVRSASLIFACAGFPVCLHFTASRENNAYDCKTAYYWRPCRSVAAAATALQTPHGDKLQNLLLSDDKKQAAIDSCTKTMECSDRNACDVELLMVGYVLYVMRSWSAAQFCCATKLIANLILECCRGFSPLEGFLNEEEYHSVVENMRMTVSDTVS